MARPSSAQVISYLLGPITAHPHLRATVSCLICYAEIHGRTTRHAGFGHLSTPLLPHHSSIGAALSSRGARAPGASAEHGPSPAANNISGSGAGTEPVAPSPTGPSGRQSHSGRGSGGAAGLAAAAVQAADREPSQERLGLIARSRSRSRAAAPGKALNTCPRALWRSACRQCRHAVWVS